MTRPLTLLIAIAALLLVSPAAIPAGELQSHASIRDAARQHAAASVDDLGNRAEVSVSPLDSRLKLTACDRPLETYDSPNGLNRGRGVVGVRCSGSRPWKLFVPVSVAIIEPVVVTRRPVVRGQALRSEDLVLTETDVSRLHKAYFTRIDDVVGLRSKRAIGAGQTLHAGLLKRERLVRRGKAVSLIAQVGGLQVSVRGKALADGSRGDQVRVENLTSGRVVSGLVAGDGLVRVLN